MTFKSTFTILSFLILSFNVFSQNSFIKQWSEIDSLQQKGLYNMALKKVNSIFLQSVHSQNHEQVIKSVFYELKYNTYLKEDDYILGIYNLESLIKQTPSPAKEILHSLTAEVYWGYYSSNRWKFSERTVLESNVKLNDIRTWDLKRIASKVNYHYLQSLQNETISQTTPIDSYEELILNTQNTKDFRPTLYDFLAHRTINFFNQNSYNLPGSAETYAMKGIAYFGSNTTFSKINITSKDKFNTKFYASKIFQNLTKFRLKDKNKSALLMLELDRIKYVSLNSVSLNKNTLYEESLKRLVLIYPNNPYVAEALYLIAEIHNAKDHTFPENKWEKQKALKICEETSKHFPGSHGDLQCKALASQIKTKNFHFNGEIVVEPNKNSKILLNYANFDTLYLKIVPIKNKDNLNISRSSIENFINKNESIYNKTIILKNPKDYHNHSMEYLIPELDNGQYIIVACSSPEFNENQNAYAYHHLWVTNITYQTLKNGDLGNVLVTERTDGNPIENATVKVYYQEYNYKSRQYVKVHLGDYKTNSLGMAEFTAKKKINSYYFAIENGDDFFNSNDRLYLSKNQINTPSTSIITHFFTDRTIYRPGQTIYFKGISYESTGEKKEVKVNWKSTVTFYDVNYQQIKNVTVTTNKFGSFTGSFVAPFGVLTGSMTIKNGHGSKSIRVEEYKRPKFSTEINPLKGEYKVNDSVKVTGVAIAFAGNKIDGADVSYRITRTTRYNYYRWGWWYGNQNTEKEIVFGKTTSDEKGEYNITFKALADETKNPKNLPIFDYIVYATVTDINGETHETKSTISVGYQSLQLGNNLPSEFVNNIDRILTISTTNLNGQPIFAKGTVKIYPLITPKQTYRKRLWSEPDMLSWDKVEYSKLFPLDEYKSENDYHTWKKDESILSESFDTEKTGELSIPKIQKWDAGMYVYEAIAFDKNGVEVKDIKYFEISNCCDKRPSINTVFTVKGLKTNVQPGEQAKYVISTSEDELYVFYTVLHKGKIVNQEWIELSNEQELIKIDVEEKHRGNFSINFSAMKNNRSYSVSKTITVPYKNKQLDLAFSTFRNKLLPGQAEEWTMTIKNKKGEKEMAELLATLYDASLDELNTPNSYFMNIYHHYYRANNWSKHAGMGQKYAINYNYKWNKYVQMPYRSYPNLNHFGYNGYYYGQQYFRGNYNLIEKDGGSMSALMVSESGSPPTIQEVEMVEDDIEVELKTISKDLKMINGNANGKPQQMPMRVDENELTKTKKSLTQIKARTNFNETAFFYPQLLTDKEGNIKIKFTIPESLTKWRFLGLAHTQNLKFGSIQEEIVTQKDLMVVPNTPRFLREGDKITLSTKISNISENDLNGNVRLQLIDPFTEQIIDTKFNLTSREQSFMTKAGQSTSISWVIDVPYNTSAVKYKIVAQAGNFSDGESNVLPILSNRMLVTETMPMPIRGKENKVFKFEKLINSASSNTLRHHKYTLEFTSNPAWYAVQAMPYMMEYPHECAEQTFTRYYSNAIASHIMNSSPKIKQVVENWGKNSPDAFLSNLNKNQELKSVMLEETPWVLDANSESESKKNLSILLDMNRMSKELDKALSKTIKTQSSNGGWPWFPGMRESRYITQHIITGMGHLDHLGIKDVRKNTKTWKMVKKGITYLDGEIVRDFERIKKWDKNYLKNQHIGYSQIQYLYARSYYPNVPMSKSTTEAIAYYKNQAKKYWLQFNIYAKGMIGLSAHRMGMKPLATDIVNSLKDNAIQHEEFGMYWKSYVAGYRWYQAPIETQAVMIELFDEVANDQKSVENLKIWLLKQKQTTNWKTTKQTTEAVYALLLKGTNLLASDELVQISVGDQPINYTKIIDNNPYNVNTQSGTGYFKTNWTGENITPNMGNVTVTKNTIGVAWGAMYWQYFEDLDKIMFAETNLKLDKQLFKLSHSTQGEVLTKITDNNTLKVGDKIRVRIELRTDRNLEYVHMKDMRASGFEPLNVLSSYKYREGLGYYEATKDASTNFFFDYIPKGTYVFEYDLRVQHKGQFSNGITTIQCMYAPEFTSHSKGIKVVVK